MEKLTKKQMMENIMIERNKNMKTIDIQNAYKYVERKSLDYVTKVYELFLTDKEHANFYYALLVR